MMPVTIAPYRDTSRQKGVIAVVKRVLVVMIAVGAAISGAYVFATDQTDSDPTACVLAGIDNLHSLITSGSGKVTENIWLRNGDGAAAEIERECQVDFAGSRARISCSEQYLRNEPTREMGAEDRAALIKVGAKRLKEYSLDSQSATVYAPGERDGQQGDTASQTYNVTRSLLHQLTRMGLGFSSSDWKSTDDTVMLALRVLGKETIDGDECYVVEYRSLRRQSGATESARTTHAWHNPSKNFALQRSRTWREADGAANKLLVSAVDVDLRQYADLWLPCRVVSTEYRKDAATGACVEDSRVTVTFDPDFRFNVPVADSRLRLSLPSGTLMRDEVLEAEYTVP